MKGVPSMNSLCENAGSSDDVPYHAKAPISQQEIDQMCECDWCALKNDLQEFLWRTENEDNPTFTDTTIIQWIKQWGAMFHQFYTEQRTRNPAQLIDWKEQISKNSTATIPEFVCEWSSFKDHHREYRNAA